MTEWVNDASTELMGTCASVLCNQDVLLYTCVCVCVRQRERESEKRACTEMPCSLEMCVFATLEELSYFILIIINNFGRVTVLYNINKPNMFSSTTCQQALRQHCIWVETACHLTDRSRKVPASWLRMRYSNFHWHWRQIYEINIIGQSKFNMYKITCNGFWF